jgi:sigma54-dependent transcription regulator
MVLVEHNTSAVLGATIVDADGITVANVGGVTVLDTNGVAVADEDAMPITIVDYRRPMPFVSGGVASLFGHSVAGRASSVALFNGANDDRCEHLSGSPDNGTHGL